MGGFKYSEVKNIVIFVESNLHVHLCTLEICQNLFMLKHTKTQKYFSILSSDNAILVLWLGLGNKTTWFGLGHVLAQLEVSLGPLKNTQFFWVPFSSVGKAGVPFTEALSSSLD